MEVRSVEAIVRALNDADVRYLVVGGLAVNAHGYVRMTMDIDLVIELSPDNIIRGLNALMAIGYRFSVPVTPEAFADETSRERWRNEKGMMVLKLWSDLHRSTVIDVFVFEPFDFPDELQKACWIDVAEHVQAPFVSYETLLAMKRDAARPKDLLDVQELQKLNPYR
jgi:hypothetical protein